MKNILKKEITKADTEINRDQTIIKEYKQVNGYNIYAILSEADNFYRFNINIIYHITKFKVFIIITKIITTVNHWCVFVD